MNITFLNPFVLFGLAAVVLPILIHRITQKQAVVRNFSAVRLLLQSERVTARPRQLKHLLILALRLLAVATIVFMMARPVLVRPGIAALLSDGARVLLLDNSLSMAYQEDRGSRYELAKRAAKESLEGFQGRVAIIPFVRISGAQDFQWMKSKEALKKLEAIPLSSGRGDTVLAFTSAYQQLKNLKTPKQILALSDMAQSDWDALDLTKFGIISAADVTFFRIGTPGRDANYRIKTARLEKDEIIVGIPARLEVIVSNLSDQAGTVQVYVNISGRKVDQKSIDLKSGQDGKILFDLMLEKPGWIDGEVRLSPDRLAPDDRFYFPLKVNEKIKVLVVDGDPKTSLKASESYYLVKALRPGRLEESAFLTQVVTESAMARVNLQSYDSLFLLNVARPNFSRLASFLEMGRPVFIFLGNRIDPEIYNRFSLAPWQIFGLNDPAQTVAKTTSIGSLEGDLKFLKALEENLKRASFKRYFKVEGPAQNLLVLTNQNPLLVTAKAGKSRLFLFTSSADLDWNNLPLKAAFVPFLQGLVKEAVGRGTSLPKGIQIGASFSDHARSFQIKGSRGGPGIFQFRLPTGELWRAVNTPYQESDLTKVSVDALEKKFGPTDIKVVEYEEGGLKDLQKNPKKLWPILLGFLLAVLALEMILANNISRLQLLRR